MDANYRVAFTMTTGDETSADEARREIERALLAAGLRVGFVAIQTSRETLRARRRAARQEAR